MSKEDLTTDDEIAAGDTPAATENDLAKQFLHPGYTWRGLKLNPYTAGTDLLFNQVLDRNDAPLTIFLAFIFIHVQDREKLVEICWNIYKFRSALLDWIDSLGDLTAEDRLAAMNLFEEIRGWARKSAVEVVPDPDAPQKKTKANRRARSRA